MRKLFSNKMLFFLFILNLQHTIGLVGAYSMQRCTEQDGADYILSTTTGDLKGQCHNVQVFADSQEIVSSVYSWLSVPYAEAPVNNLRFKKPVSKRGWRGVLSASEWPSSCLRDPLDDPNDMFKIWFPESRRTSQSEDCLYLNIFVSELAYLKISKSEHQMDSGIDYAPIIVYFLGGGSVKDNTNIKLFDASRIAALDNVVVVTVNYRLDVFGFLHLNAENPGNQGLHDQIAALQWIKLNARRFGADPNRITIAAHGTAASLLGHHLFISQSWQLFDNVIMQSGSPFSLKTLDINEANKRTLQLVKFLNCSSDEVESCLMQFSSEEILNASVKLFKSVLGDNLAAEIYLGTYYPPVVDKQLLTEDIEMLAKAKAFKVCPVLTGLMAGESVMSILATGLVKPVKSLHLNYAKFEEFLRKYFERFASVESKSDDFLVSLVLNNYMEENLRHTYQLTQKEKSKNHLNKLVMALTDQAYICPAYKLANYVSALSDNVYVYMLSYYTQHTPLPTWGTMHGDDLELIFGYPLANKTSIQNNEIPWSLVKEAKRNETDAHISHSLIQYWNEFAKTGKPNKESLITWPNYVNSQHKAKKSAEQHSRYLLFKSNKTTASSGYSVDNCYFWNYALPDLLDTYEKMVKKRVSEERENFECAEEEEQQQKKQTTTFIQSSAPAFSKKDPKSNENPAKMEKLNKQNNSASTNFLSVFTLINSLVLLFNYFLF